MKIALELCKVTSFDGRRKGIIPLRLGVLNYSLTKKGFVAMNLYRIGDRHVNYKETYFKGRDLKGLEVYSAENHNVGSVDDFLIDDNDQLQYVVVKSSSQRKTLLPIGRCTDVPNENRIYTPTLNREEFKLLPRYDDSQYDNSQVGETNQTLRMYQTNPVERSLPVEATIPVEARKTIAVQAAAAQAVPPQPQEVEGKDRPIQLYEERLTARKQRVKTGEIKISKRTVTERQSTSTPITREKVIIEIESVYGGETRVDFSDAEVAEDGTMRMGIYEEQTEVCRRVVPYQNVNIRKEVVQDVVETQETIRREELDVTSDGAPVTDLVDWQ